MGRYLVQNLPKKKEILKKKYILIFGRESCYGHLKLWEQFSTFESLLVNRVIPGFIMMQASSIAFHVLLNYHVFIERTGLTDHSILLKSLPIYALC